MTQQPDETDKTHGRTLHDPGPGKVMPHDPTAPGSTTGATSEEPPDEPGKEMPHTPTA